MTDFNSNLRYNSITNHNLRVDESGTPDILTTSLIVLFHIRFIFLVILHTRTTILDAIFYFIVLAALCTLKLNKYCLVLVPLLFISLVNSAAQNIFLILSSSYIVAVKLPLKKVMKINVICVICVLLLVTLLVKAGIVQEHVGTSHFYINGAIYNQRYRSDLGFGNPNRVAILIYSITINAYLLITQRRLNLFIVSVILVSAFIYKLTISRTFVFTITIFIIACIGLKFALTRKVFLKTRMLLFYLPLVFLIMIIWLVKTGYYNINIEILTSGRLGLFKDLISHCTLQDYLIGTNLINEKTIDNTYLHLLFSAGIIGLIAAFFLWYKLVSKLDKTTLITYPILSSFALYGFAESIWTMLLCYGNMIVWIMMIKNLILPEEYRRELKNLAAS